jgi:hypothetical protein
VRTPPQLTHSSPTSSSSIRVTWPCTAVQVSLIRANQRSHGRGRPEVRSARKGDAQKARISSQTRGAVIIDQGLADGFFRSQETGCLVDDQLPWIREDRGNVGFGRGWL